MTTDDAGGGAPSQGVRVSRTLPADPERAWTALTDPQEISAWFWPRDYATTAETDVRVGGRYRIASDARGMAIEGEYLEVAPPRRLVTSWRWGEDAAASVVRIDVLGGVQGSGVVLTHDGLPREDVEPYEQGWTGSLDRLVTHLS